MTTTSSLIEDDELREIAVRKSLDKWEWGESSQGAKLLMMEGAALALRECGTDLDQYFPKVWGPRSDGLGGKDVTDPLTIYLTHDEDLVASFSLKAILANTLEMCREDGSFSAGLRQISLALKALSAEIDAATGDSQCSS